MPYWVSPLILYGPDEVDLGPEFGCLLHAFQTSAFAVEPDFGERADARIEPIRSMRSPVLSWRPVPLGNSSEDLTWRFATADEEGNRISEWRMSCMDIEEFVAKAAHWAPVDRAFVV